MEERRGGSNRRIDRTATRWAALDGGVIVMDLRAGDYVALDPVASSIWTSLAKGADDESIAASLHEAFGVEPDVVAADVASFVALCTERGYLSADAAPEPPRPRKLRRSRRFLAASALFALVRTRASLAWRGLGPTYRETLAIEAAACHRHTDLLLRAERAFLRAENLYLSRRVQRDCLPRSIALHRFLLASGVRARHLIGVKANPFQAHAWVEAGGRPVLDWEERTSQFQIIASTA